MSIIPHILVASLSTKTIETVGKKYISNIWLRATIVTLTALPVAFFSHFSVDMFPHWDPRFFWEYIGVPRYLLWKMVPDLILMSLLLVGHKLKLWRLECLFQSWLAFIAGIAAMTPDFIVIYWQRTPYFQDFIHFHHRMHAATRPGPYWGMVLPILFTFVLAVALTELAKQPNIFARLRTTIYKLWASEQTFET